MRIKAFTIAADGPMQELPCDVTIRQASTIDSSSDKQVAVGGLWDTGASKSAITPKVAKRLSLEPVGMVEVHTAAGVRFCNVYIVDLLLPNDISIPNIEVIEADMPSNDALIGMDVITLGDFAITNLRGNTRFSFSIPSVRSIDFVQEAEGYQNASRSTRRKNKLKRKLERTNKKKGRRGK